MKTPKLSAWLVSSHGKLEFNTRTGLVTDSSCMGLSFGALPVFINIHEWRAHYPAGVLAGSEHDILDFGYVDANGVYNEPCGSWREDLVLSRKGEL